MLVRWMGPVSHKPVRYGKINFLKYLISSRYEKELEVELVDLKVNAEKERKMIKESFFSSKPSNGKYGNSNITLLDSGLPVDFFDQFVKTNGNREKLIVNDRKGGFIKKEMYPLIDGIVTYSLESFNQYSSALPTEKVLLLKPSVDPVIFYPTSERKELDLVCLINIKGKEKRKKAIADLLNTVGRLNVKALIICKKKEAAVFNTKGKNIKLVAAKDKDLASLLRKSAIAFALCEGSDNCLIPEGFLEAGACGAAVISNYHHGNQPGFTSGSHYLCVTGIEELAEAYNSINKDRAQSRAMVENMLRSINKNYTNWHRSNELFNFLKIQDQSSVTSRVSASM